MLDWLLWSLMNPLSVIGCVMLRGRCKISLTHSQSWMLACILKLFSDVFLYAGSPGKDGILLAKRLMILCGRVE